jgi:hypothetical protein
MGSRIRVPAGIMLCLLIVGFTIPGAYAGEQAADAADAAVLFLLITNSARINGMGGCAINVVDEQSPLYNPGALGLFHLDKLFSVSFPNSTDWLPSIDPDLKIKSFAVSGGGSARRITSVDTDYDFAVGLAYSSLEADYGEMNITDHFGNTIGRSHNIDKADYYSAGLGIELYARLGIGVSLKKIRSNLAVLDSADNIVFASSV